MGTVGARPAARGWRDGRVWLLVGTLAAGGVGLAAWPPISQDPAYHHLADGRSCLGLPNCLNVLSNAPFVAVGLAGLAFLAGRGARNPGQAFVDPAERWAYVVLFVGVFLTGFGSAYYHAAPDNLTLFWDRLPLAVVFPALLAAVVSERIDVRAGRWLLPPLAGLGVLSVVLWRAGEAAGHGDLRLYGLVQFYPMLAIPLMLWLFPPRYTRTADLWGVVAWYAGAKVFEALDHQLFALGHLVSGHTVKHLLSVAGAGAILGLLRRRRPAGSPA
jgi:hypothetical protein